MHVHFACEGTDYDFDLDLLPSIFTTTAAIKLASGNVPAADVEPPAYGGGAAMFMLGSHGHITGSVWTSDGHLSIDTKGNGRPILAERTPNVSRITVRYPCAGSICDTCLESRTNI